MTTKNHATRFLIVNASNRPADDLGDDPVFASEAAAEEAVESLAASGFDMDTYSVRELTTDDLVGDERIAMIEAVGAEAIETAQQERAEHGTVAAWKDFLGMTPSWDSLDAMLARRFGCVRARGRDLDDVTTAYRAGRESVLLPAKTEATYSVSYRTPSYADESTRNTLDTEPKTDVSLDDVIRICRLCDCEAELFNAAGDRKGWVHADGTYTLR